jgi:hypothetical protein
MDTKMTGFFNVLSAMALRLTFKEYKIDWKDPINLQIAMSSRPYEPFPKEKDLNTLIMGAYIGVYFSQVNLTYDQVNTKENRLSSLWKLAQLDSKTMHAEMENNYNDRPMIPIFEPRKGNDLNNHTFVSNLGPMAKSLSEKQLIQCDEYICFSFCSRNQKADTIFQSNISCVNNNLCWSLMYDLGLINPKLINTLVENIWVILNEVLLD